MKVIRQLLIAWMLVAFFVLHGFGQDAKPPPPPPRPLPLPTKIIPKSVSEENSSKPKAEVRKIVTSVERLPRKDFDWSDFTYNSPEEKAFWDKLPERSFSSKILNGYVKSKSYFDRTIYQYVEGNIVRSKTLHIGGQKKSECNYKDGKLDGLQTGWYENGQQKQETNYKDGKLNGLQTNWYENGQKEREINCKDGKLRDVKVWLPDGKECPKSKVIDGNGTLYTYSLEGKEEYRMNFKDGMEHGPRRKHLSSGTIIMPSHNAVPDRRTTIPPPRPRIPPRSEKIVTSVARLPRTQHLAWPDFTYNSPEEKAFWDKLPDWSYKELVSSNAAPTRPDTSFKRNVLGETIESNSSEGYDGYVKKKVLGYRAVYQFVNGYAIRSKTWSKDGQKKEEKTYKDGIWDGLETRWYENGQKKSELNYKDGKLMSAERWKPNGEKCPETNFKDGNGVVVEYYENGQKRSDTNYKNGKKDGLKTYWRENGQKSSQKNYKVGKEDGLSTAWHENGQKKSEVNYKDGKMEGYWTSWYENGKKYREWYYKDGRPTVPPLNPRPPPKRPASSEANSSKPTPPSPPPWLVPAAPK